MLTQGTYKALCLIEILDFLEDLHMVMMTDTSRSLTLVTTDQNGLLNQKGLDFSHHLDLDGMCLTKNLWILFQTS